MRWSAMSMQYRITISVAVGVVVILVVFGYFAFTAVRDAREAAEQERLASAEALASHVDDLVERLAEQLAFIARRTAAAWPAGDSTRADAVRTYEPLLPGSRLILRAADGGVIWSSVEARSLQAAGAPGVLTTDNGDVTVWPCSTAGGGGLLCLEVEVRRSVAGGLLGSLTLIADPADPTTDALPRGLLERGSEAELLGSGGVLLASTEPRTNATDHTAVLTDAIAARTPAVAIHGEGSGEHLVAYVPLRGVPGLGVAIEQRRDVALAVADSLRRRVLLFAPVALAVAVALAWLDVRRVVRPLRRLTQRAREMASGDLTQPVDIVGQGEVRELAASFEEMRVQLRASVTEIEQRDRDLEERVRERTAQVAVLYQELQLKEEARSRLLDAVMTAQEEERARVARELHDETAQTLTAAALELESAAEELDAEPTAAADRLGRALTLARRSIEELRRTIADLRPVNLDELGLVAAVRELAEERLESAGVRVTLRSEGIDRRLPWPAEIGLFRIIQEAVSNVARHAGATRTEISLRLTGEHILAVVADDGAGFRPEDPPHNGAAGQGVGLLGMRERASLLGGTLQIESAPGNGTRVLVELPIQAALEEPEQV